MSDITFMKGYGFPRGSAMDYAGYAGNPDPNAGDLNVGPVRFEGPTMSPMRIRNAPDPRNFAPIQALEGIFCEEGYGPVSFEGMRWAQDGFGPVRYGAYGSSIQFGPLTTTPTSGFYGPTGIGADGLVHYPDGSTCDPSQGPCANAPNAGPDAGALLWGMGLLALGWALFMKR